MDSFKLLTRSAKLKPKAAVTKQSSANPLPSAGEAANPQLFAREEAEQNRGTKRKRRTGNNNPPGNDLADIDFFGYGNSASTAATDTPSKGADDLPERDEIDDVPPQEENISEPERKSVLKSHKIKVTDLRTPTPTNEVNTRDTKKERKKKKRGKSEPAPAPLSRKQKKAAQQMYPHPLTQFAQLRRRYGISRRLAENILNQGYTVPTEVQLGSLPLLFGDCPNSAARGGGTEDTPQQPDPEQEPDLLVVAPTGSGKTLAFLLPLINTILRHHHEEPKRQGILSVVVAPTKELVAQIVNEGRKLTAGTGVKITAMRKGMRVAEARGMNNEPSSEGSEDESSDDAKRPSKKKKGGDIPVTKSDILVSTPLMLVNALSDNGTKDVASLPSIRSLILDEADVLLDPLFRDQTLSIWHACTDPQLRVGLWSATMGSNIEELTKSTIQDRQSSLGLKEESSLVRVVVGLKDSAIPNISHRLIYAATEQGKLLGLRQLLHPTASTSQQTAHLRPPFLVFTQTISRAVALHSELMYDIPPEAGGSSRIAVLHSELSDSHRTDVMAGFRKGEVWILITTDLLARGVDFRGINGVVNYDIPNSSAAYVHRVGRTGRAGREGGAAVTYYTKEDIPYVKAIANVIAASEKLRGADASEKSVQKWLLDALPDLSKRDRKELKQHGVRVRLPTATAGKDGKERTATRISTKSGYERRMENNKRGALQGAKRRREAPKDEDTAAYENDSWGGIED